MIFLETNFSYQARFRHRSELVIYALNLDFALLYACLNVGWFLNSYFDLITSHHMLKYYNRVITVYYFFILSSTEDSVVCVYSKKNCLIKIVYHFLHFLFTGISAKTKS